ncbi:MAG: epoxyqueuosine reductase QueH [Acholeplasmatales bacterium]|jgi:predicted adenine nucleotide alpha hydrolase (AANH) superfamily ATPase|nr:epoxyqueuosine reductase QueH [Acholeplasmatales bacterium]
MKLLLHCCCGPCSIFIIDKLLKDGHEVFLLFYNPNIHPDKEKIARIEALQVVASKYKVPLFVDSKDMIDLWLAQNKKRCNECYESRINYIAKYAAENGFSYFLTSLLISPYQNHELIKELSQKYAKLYGINFYYEDFRKDFRTGQNMAKELGIYRQKYCGCIISLNDNNKINV